MSIDLIRQALEVRLKALSPSFATAWQNWPYTPVNGTPYQRVHLLPAAPRNPTFGGGTVHTAESGILQVSLYYPANVGTAAADARAKLVRAHFKQGTSLTAGAVTVRIERTPTIHPALQEPDWWVVPVSIRYRTNTFT